MFVVIAFILLLLLIIGSILWLLWFALRTKQFETGKLIGLVILVAILFGIVLLGINEVVFLLKRSDIVNRDQNNSQESKATDTAEKKLSDLRDQYLEYGIGDDLIIGVFGTLLLAMVGIGTFEALKAKSEEQSRVEKLYNSTKCIERLSHSKLFEETYDISKNLFGDIFKEFKQDKKLKLSNPICTAYLSNLGVYGLCRLENVGIDKELKNLIEVEKIYEELVQTLYQSTIWPIKEAASGGWEERTSVFANEFILGKKNDERHTVHTFLWHARFLNSWADVLIRLCRHVERSRYLAQAKIVLGWARVGVFELADEKDIDGEIHHCLEFILERARYHRLRGDLFHEQNHIAYHPNIISYKNGNGSSNEKGLEDAEREYRRALRCIALQPPYTIGGESEKNALPEWLEYQPKFSLSSCSQLRCSWEKDTDEPGAANTTDSLERILRGRVKSAIEKGFPSHYLWSDIERCKCQSNRIRKILDHIDETDIKPKDTRKPSQDEFMTELLTETTKIYLRVAQNNFRYIAEANERNEFLPEDEYNRTDRLINIALGYARSLINLELSWRQSVLFYDNLGIYLLEKGRYEERLGNLKQADELYNSASRVHEMTRLHLTECSNDGAHIAEGTETSEDSEWYNNVNYLIFLRNLIDLGRTRQYLYRLQYGQQFRKYPLSALSEYHKEMDFKAARRILLQALKISTETDNFICRAEAHLILADLYTIDRINWGPAIMAYRNCIETFTKDEYIAYHDKVCDKLADFYATHYQYFDNVQRTVFVKSFNLCFDYDNQDICKHYQRRRNFRQHIRELIKWAPKECSEITNGRCCPHYWPGF